MNNLSWLIYLADAAGSLCCVITAMSVAAGITSAVCLVASLAAETTWGCEGARRIMRRSAPCMVICAIIAALLPSRQTVLMIAASEVGQRVAGSQQVAGMVDPGLELVRTWIQTTTEELKHRNDHK